MTRSRQGARWTAIRFAIVAAGWSIMSFAPLEGGTDGAQSIWGENPDARGFLVLIAIGLLLLAASASSGVRAARTTLWVVFGVLVVAGLVITVAALLLIPFAAAVVVLRVRSAGGGHGQAQLA